MSEPVFDGGRREEILDNTRQALSARMGDLWWTFMVRGILAAILGIVALFWPADSISALLRITGLFLIVDGAVTLFSFWKKTGSQAESGSGIVSLVLGLVLLFLPTGSARFVFILLGLWALVRGLAHLLTWWQTPSSDPERNSARNAGIIADMDGPRVRSIWCRFRNRTAKERDRLIAMLSALDGHRRLLVMDWRRATVVDLTVREQVDAYFA